MQSRLETADILPLVKETALANLLHATPDDIWFIVSVLITTSVALWFINQALLRGTLALTRLTLPTFFMGAYIILMSVPATVWFFADPTGSVRYTYFLAMQSVLISFPIGVLLANMTLLDRTDPGKIVREFYNSPLLRSPDDRYILPLWVALILSSIIVAGYYVSTSSYVPLIGALTAYGEVPGSVVRSSVFWEGDLLHYAHALTGRFAVPFCLVYAYFMADVYRGTWRKIYWVTLVIAIFVSSMTFDRTYPFSIAIFIGLSIYFRHQNSATSRRSSGHTASSVRRLGSNAQAGIQVALMVAVAMAVGGIISRTQYNLPLTAESIWATSANFFIDRVLLDASYMAYIYFDEFNKPTTFLYGQSFHVLVSWVFGIDFHPTISPSFVAELWINFGWFGVLLGTVLIGFVLQLLQLKLFARKTIPTLSFFIILLLNGAWIIYGHILATMVISVYLPSVLFLILLRRRRRAVSPPVSHPSPSWQSRSI